MEVLMALERVAFDTERLDDIRDNVAAIRGSFKEHDRYWISQI
jgi:hypothetical protein